MSWQAQTLPTTNALRGLAHGLGMHVVTSARGEIFTSPDGTNWVARSSRTTNALNGVTCANGLLMAVGGSTTSRIVVASTNGMDWSVTSQLAGAELRSVAFGQGRFVAVSTYQYILSSVDGTTWVMNRPGATQRWWDIAFADGVFVAVGGVGSYVMATSADGINWTLRTPGGSNHRGVTHGNGTFLTVGDWGVIVQSDPRVWLSLQAGPASAVVVSGPLGDYRLDYLEEFGPTSTWLTLTNVTLGTSPWICPITDEATHRFYRAVWLP